MRPDIFSWTLVGDIPVANRIAMAPMKRARADINGVHSPFASVYYGQRASAGLIVTEATFITQQGCGSAFAPGICTDAHVDAWKLVTEAVHAKGGRIVIQLWHAGRISHTSLQNGGAAPVAPSAIPAGGKVHVECGFVPPSAPRPLSLGEIEGIIRDFRVAAENAKVAGFDGVEVHAANSFLLEQFIRDNTNQRTDQYGGSIENRTRLTVEVSQAVAEVFGAGRVGVRLSPIAFSAGDKAFDSNPHATYGFLADRLGKLGLAYLHCVEGAMRGIHDSESFDFHMLREKFGGCYIANNGYSFDLARRAIAAGRADLVAFGRPFIANPDLVERFRQGAQLAEAPRESYYGGGASGYIDWPFVGLGSHAASNRPSEFTGRPSHIRLSHRQQHYDQ
jgi:N-ethylmaleimide reductase